MPSRLNYSICFICCFILIFIFFSARAQPRFATDPSVVLPFARSVLGWPWLYSVESLYSVHAIPCLCLCLMMAFVATPCFFSQGAKSPINHQSTHTRYLQDFQGWVRAAMHRGPDTRCGTPRSRGCKSFLQCSYLYLADFLNSHSIFFCWYSDKLEMSILFLLRILCSDWRISTGPRWCLPAPHRKEHPSLS